MEEERILKLNGRTLAVIDWANVYGWTKKLKWQVDAQKLFDFLKSYPEIFDIRFYFGVEKGNEKSEKFQEEIIDIGYNLISKEVKWVPLSLEITHFKNKTNKIQNIASASENKEFYNDFNANLKKLHTLFGGHFYRRKCDFDVEITKDILINIDSFDALVLFTGDGDYEAIVEYLLNLKKKAIVVHPFGARGREYNDLLKRENSRPYFLVANNLKFILE